MIKPSKLTKLKLTWWRDSP